MFPSTPCVSNFTSTVWTLGSKDTSAQGVLRLCDLPPPPGPELDFEGGGVGEDELSLANALVLLEFGTSGTGHGESQITLSSAFQVLSSIGSQMA